MTAIEYPLITFYKGWGTYQRMLVDLVTPLTSEQLELSIGVDKWTVGRTLQHLVANRVWWFQLWMDEGQDELAPLIDWDPGGVSNPPGVSAPELVSGLVSTWAMIGGALARWTPSDLETIFSAPTTLSKEEQEMFGDKTRQWIIWHVLEHEIHHGGEISLVLGTHGFQGIYGDF